MEHCKIWTRKHEIACFLISLILLFSLFVFLLVYNSSWRVYLLVGVAIIGTVFSTLPVDKPLVRWAAVLISSLCVGIGTWYTVFQFDKEISELEDKVGIYTLFLNSTSQLPIEAKDALILQMASTLRSLIGGPIPEPEKALDLCKILLTIDPKNGHGLYFSGEAYRLKGDRENMRGLFKQYLAVAETISESGQGDSEAGYMRPDGYAGERTAWILHILANDFYEQSQKETDITERKMELNLSINDARKAKLIQPSGFEKTPSFDSTDKIIEECEGDLKKLP